MLFSDSKINFQSDVLYDTIPLKQIDCIKFLGIFIDNKLNWSNHIDYLCKLISRNVGIINKLKHFFPSDVLYNIYNALVLPYNKLYLLLPGARQVPIYLIEFLFCKRKPLESSMVFIFVALQIHYFTNIMH